MKRLIGVAVLALAAISCQENTSQPVPTVEYHETKKVDTVDTYFGVDVPDPYRWLEDDRSEETEAWVDAQNAVTNGFLDTIPFRDELKARLKSIWNYEKVTAPFKEGEYTYFRKNDGLQNQYVVYRYKTGDDPETAEVFLDPNTFKEDGTISLSGLSFSEDGSLAAYSISEGGSDWRKILIMDVASKEIIEDTLRDVKFSGISWYKNEGFYYSSYDKPEGSELSAKTDQHKLYYHKLGTDQDADPVVFGATPTEKHRYVGGGVSEDNKWLSISASVSTSGNKMFLKDLENPDRPLITVIDNVDSDTYMLDNDGDTLYLVTNLNAPNQRIVKTNASNPSPENWEDVIPETEHVLSPSTGGGYIFAEYSVDAISKVMQYNYDGSLVREVALPGIGSAGGFYSKKEEKEIYFNFTNYYTPGSIFTYQADSGEVALYRKSAIDFNPDNYESKQVFRSSQLWLVGSFILSKSC